MLALWLALLAASAPADLELLGMVTSGPAGRSVAILRAGRSMRVAAVGEPAFGGRLVALGAGGATLDFAGETVRLRLATGATALTAPAATPPAAAVSKNPPEDPATPSRVMEKREVERRIAGEMNRILAETA